MRTCLWVVTFIEVNMKEQPHDPGTGTRFNTDATRLINPDGSYNVVRKGSLDGLHDMFHYLVNISWTRLHVIVVIAFFSINLLFASIYFLLDGDCLNGAKITGSTLDHFLSCFYFSVQTMTTVGYGHIYPSCHSVHIIASIEALIGLMTFALMTGILYGRFSKPTARILFSEHALISPFNGGKAFMLRFANKRSSVLLHLKVNVLYSFNKQNEKGEWIRAYERMPLQFDSIQALPLSWTLVHPLDDESPIKDRSLEQMKEEHGEILIQVKAFDETYHAEINARYSYSADTIVENARFLKAFDTGPNGSIILDLSRIDAFERL